MQNWSRFKISRILAPCSPGCKKAKYYSTIRIVVPGTRSIDSTRTYWYSSGTQDMTRLSFFQWIFNNGCVLFFLRTHPLDQRDIYYALRLNSQYQSNEWGRIWGGRSLRTVSLFNASQFCSKTHVRTCQNNNQCVVSCVPEENQCIYI